MKSLFKHRLWYALLIGLLVSSCAPKPIFFVIDGEMDRKTWGGKRKINPGDIIFIEIFESNGHGKGKIVPKSTTLRIPVRRVSDSSSLKDYEKHFLMSVLGSNAKRVFDIEVLRGSGMLDPPALEFVRIEQIKFWNYFVDHIYIVRDPNTNNFKKTDILFDFDSISYSSPFKKAFIDSPATIASFRRIIAVPRKLGSLYEYFTPVYNQHADHAGYYRPKDSSGDLLPFISISFSVQVNGLSYENSRYFKEEGSWSVDDWVNSGTYLLKGMKRDTSNVVKKIGFKNVPGLYKITCDGLSVSTDSISYDGQSLLDTGIIKRDGFRNKTLKAKDLQVISPAIVRKIKFARKL